MRDPDSAPVRPPVRAALRMLDALTLAPAAFGPAHVEPVRAAGMGDEAVADAITVCALFSMIDRCADALGFVLPESFDPARLLALGYLPR